MGSGDPSGLQNRRDLASLGLVSSTLTRFRQIWGDQHANPLVLLDGAGFAPEGLLYFASIFAPFRFLCASSHVWKQLLRQVGPRWIEAYNQFVVAVFLGKSHRTLLITTVSLHQAKYRGSFPSATQARLEDRLSTKTAPQG